MFKRFLFSFEGLFVVYLSVHPLPLKPASLTNFPHLSEWLFCLWEHEELNLLQTRPVGGSLDAEETSEKKREKKGENLDSEIGLLDSFTVKTSAEKWQKAEGTQVEWRAVAQYVLWFPIWTRGQPQVAEEVVRLRLKGKKERRTQHVSFLDVQMFERSFNNTLHLILSLLFIWWKWLKKARNLWAFIASRGLQVQSCSSPTFNELIISRCWNLCKCRHAGGLLAWTIQVC